MTGTTCAAGVEAVDGEERPGPDKGSLRRGLLSGVLEREVAKAEALSEGLGLFSSKLQK